MGVPFHKYFIETVNGLCGYYADQDQPPKRGFKTAFATFIDNYGTHYINRQGGRCANGSGGWRIVRYAADLGTMLPAAL